jgi:hypothetical protein
MKNEPNSKLLRLALICSIILNLAFIGGFIIKRTISSRTNNTINSSEESEFQCPASGAREKGNKHHRDKDFLGIRKLCNDNPEFRKLHREHGINLKANMEKMYLLRKEMLERIKSGAVNEKDLNGIIADFNAMNTEFETNNIKHLLSLKKILKKEDFDMLMDRLIYELSTHKQSFKKFVGKNENNKNNPK